MKYTKEQATQKAFDLCNLEGENTDIFNQMNKFSILRNLPEADRDQVRDEIAIRMGLMTASNPEVKAWEDDQIVEISVSTPPVKGDKPMTTTKTTTWDGVGKDTSNCKNLESVLKRSGLDYNVGFQPVHLPSGLIVPHRLATVRESDNHVYDIVSDKYRIVQNREAFDFVNYMGDEIQFEKAGETNNGMIYIIAKLPDVNILGDSFTPHVIFRNGFSGNVKITAAICPLRIICQNQFNFAFKNTANSITIRHVGNAEAKLKEAQKVLKVSADFMTELNTQAEQYAKIKMTKAEVERVIGLLFPIDESKPMNAFAAFKLNEAKAKFIAAYDEEDNRNFRGTGWGIVNAYTAFITHRQPMGPTETKNENKFITTVFHPALMNEILRMVSMVKTNA